MLVFLRLVGLILVIYLFLLQLFLRVFNILFKYAKIEKLIRSIYFTAFNFLVNFGVAYTYPLFISIAMMLGIPLNASKQFSIKLLTYHIIRLKCRILNL